MKSLYLFNNQLTGSIPDFSHLTSLTALKLHNNPLLCRNPAVDYSAWSDLNTYPLCTTAYTLTVIISGNGSVASNPTGINCGVDCSEDYTVTDVELTATPASGSTFTGWGVSCNGSANPITVPMNSAKDCTAYFDAPIIPPSFPMIAWGLLTKGGQPMQIGTEVTYINESNGGAFGTLITEFERRYEYGYGI